MSTHAPPVLGLLHTSPVHVATFEALAADHAPGVALRHLVRPDLLADARSGGPDAVAPRVAAATDELDVDVVLCTCSTIGGVAERVGAGRVVRVDRPMAAAAVGIGTPIAVLAALDSTLAPTLDLLGEEAARAGLAPELHATVVPDAWARFEAGDLSGYHGLVARAVEEAADAGAAVVVLAQASMAPAAALAVTDVPVLSSPRLGLAAAARLLTRSAAG